MLIDILVYFCHAAVVVFGCLSLLWVISFAAKDASLVDIFWGFGFLIVAGICLCLLYTSPSPRDQRGSRMPSSA